MQQLISASSALSISYSKSKVIAMNQNCRSVLQPHRSWLPAAQRCQFSHLPLSASLLPGLVDPNLLFLCRKNLPPHPRKYCSIDSKPSPQRPKPPLSPTAVGVGTAQPSLGSHCCAHWEPVQMLQCSGAQAQTSCPTHPGCGAVQGEQEEEHPYSHMGHLCLPSPASEHRKGRQKSHAPPSRVTPAPHHAQNHRRLWLLSSTSCTGAVGHGAGNPQLCSPGEPSMLQPLPVPERSPPTPGITTTTQQRSHHPSIPAHSLRTAKPAPHRFTLLPLLLSPKAPPFFFFCFWCPPHFAAAFHPGSGRGVSPACLAAQPVAVGHQQQSCRELPGEK